MSKDRSLTDFSNDLVMRVPAGGGAPTTIANNLAMPYGLAADTSGNVYIADSNDYFVLKVPGSGLCSGIYSWGCPHVGNTISTYSRGGGCSGERVLRNWGMGFGNLRPAPTRSRKWPRLLAAT